jgi:hypothetical protein
MRNRGRLDELSGSNFTSMTLAQRQLAFEYLVKMVLADGSRNTVNGLFIEDASRATTI